MSNVSAEAIAGSLIHGPLLESTLLTQLADRVDAISGGNVLHAVWLPIAPLTLVHAIRLAQITREVQGWKQRPLLQELILNQLLLWSTVIVIATILAIPSPLLLSGPVVLTYCTVHAVWTRSGLSDAMRRLSQVEGLGLALDLFWLFIDAVTRSEGIMLFGADLVRAHPDRALASSPFAAIAMATALGGATVLIMDLFDLSNPQGRWGVRTPEFLTTNPSLLVCTDMWSSALLGFLHLALTDSRGFGVLGPSPASISSFYSTVVPRWAQRTLHTGVVRAGGTAASALKLGTSSRHIAAGKLALGDAHGGYLSSRDVRIVLTLVLFTIFAAQRIARALPQATHRPVPAKRMVNGNSPVPSKRLGTTPRVTGTGKKAR